MTNTTTSHAEALRQKIAEAYEQIANLSDIARWGYQDEINVLHALITDYEAALVKIAPPTPDAHYEPIRADELKVGDYIKYHAEWREILDVKCKTGLVSVTIDDRPRPLVFLPDVQVSTVIAHAVLPSTSFDIAPTVATKTTLTAQESGYLSHAKRLTEGEGTYYNVEMEITLANLVAIIDRLTGHATLAEHAEEHVLPAKSNTQPANLVIGVDLASPAGDVSAVTVAHTDNGTLMVDAIVTDDRLAFHEKMQSLNEMQCMFGSKPPTHHDLLAGDL